MILLGVKITARKVSKYGVIFGPYCTVFGLNTKIYSVNLPLQSECRKVRTRNSFVFGHFSRSEYLDTGNSKVSPVNQKIYR